MRTKAERVHHAVRIKRKVSRYWTAGDKSPRAIGIAARTRQICSCMGCGNTARYEGDKAKYKSLFQRRLFEDWGDQ